MLTVWTTIFVIVLLVLAFIFGLTYGHTKRDAELANELRTECEDCGKQAVFFNPYNNVTQCHLCGTVPKCCKAADCRTVIYTNSVFKNIDKDLLDKLQASLKDFDCSRHGRKG